MEQTSFAGQTSKKPISFANLGVQARTYRKKANSITFGYHKMGKGFRGSIVIGEFLMVEAGFLIGDRIDIIYHPDDRMVIITRVGPKEAGLKISKAYKDSGRGRVSFTWREPIPFHEGNTMMEGVEIKKDSVNTQKCIYFDVPKCFTFYNGEE